eukprot:CAMPEP_0177561848 /NCGR_PEP_ID=MMETSP0369-20130122/72170_1 /TAXON_ID=447022 ORGANISM="Scrippsiella hangoei-like, Strain SHHI-4" /NCGR_SAMPLE_ID=MMETSP0369 /ASSEMBLY_ACC=CAM_ASM_000364 /LENGTH=171 /DNA_ID=CAMNT_0019048835 /DNA_START=16 /DNA_END=531 /DNA_ORIENTATION=-
MASLKPTNCDDIRCCFELEPNKNTLILIGSHEDSFVGLDAFTDAVILGNKQWTQENHIDGQRFYLEDLETMQEFFPDTLKDGIGRSSDDDRVRPGPNLGKASLGFLRKLDHYYSVQMGKGPDAVKLVGRAIAEECETNGIEKVIVAFCFGALNPVVRQFADDLRVHMTIRS